MTVALDLADGSRSWTARYNATDIGDALRASEQGYSASEAENQEAFRAIASRFCGHSA